MYIMRNAKNLPECHLQCSKPCSSQVLHSSRRFSSLSVPAGRSNLRNPFRNRIPLINAHYNRDSHLKKYRYVRNNQEYYTEI